MPTLAQRPCIPCRGGVEPLTREQCARYLAEVSDWQLDATAHCIKRRFQFRDYRTALAFANAVSVLAEEVWHHPELALGWGFCDDARFGRRDDADGQTLTELPISHRATSY